MKNHLETETTGPLIILYENGHYALPLKLPSYIWRVQSFAKAVPSMRQYTHTSSRLNCSRLSQTYPLKQK